MPILDPRYISNWYVIEDAADLDATGTTSPRTRLFENYRQTNDNDVSTKAVIGGDIGPRVASIGGITWKADASSPVIIVEDSFGTAIASIFDTIITQFAVLQNPNYQRNAAYLMQSASIKVSAEGVNCSIGFISDKPSPFNVLQYSRSSTSNFIGRVAKNFDTVISISTFDINNLPFTRVYQIIDADISISATIGNNYFPGTGQSPYLSVQGYKVSGSVSILAAPEEFVNFYVPAQQPGTFVVKSLQSTQISIGSSYLDLGAISITGRVGWDMAANDLTKVSMTFENLLGYTGVIV